MTERSNTYAKTNTEGHFIHVVFNAPSTASHIDVDWAKIGVSNSEDLPKARKKFTPPKLHDDISKPFKRVQRGGYSILDRYAISVMGIRLLSPWNKKEVKTSFFKLEAEWQNHLEWVNENFYRYQSEVLDEVVSDPLIQDWEHRESYIDFVVSRMPTKTEYIKRHRRFIFEMIDIKSGSHQDDEFDDARGGLERIREGAAGVLIQELALGANSFLEKVENGNVQGQSQRLLNGFVEKCDEFQFLNPRFAYLSQILENIIKMLPMDRTVKEPKLIAQLKKMVRPIADQFLLEEVVFENRDLYVTDAPASTPKASETSEAIVRAEKERLERKNEQFKKDGHDHLMELRKQIPNGELHESMNDEEEDESGFQLKLVDFDDFKNRGTQSN